MRQFLPHKDCEPHRGSFQGCFILVITRFLETEGASVPSSEDDDVSFDLRAIIKLDTTLGELGDLAIVLQFDLPINDQLTGSRICEILGRTSSTHKKKLN